jgi:hypothetical protein
MLNIDIIRQWIELDKQKKQHEVDIDDIKSKMAFLEEAIINNLIEEGVDSCRVNGFSISPKTNIFAVIVDGDKERAYEALRSAGYGQYVTQTVNSKSLSALVSDLIQSEGKLPDEFNGAITTFEKIRLSKKKI